MAFSRQTRNIVKPSYHQNYCIDSNQILHNSNDQQIALLFVGSYNMYQMNQRQRTAAISQKKSINRHISATTGPIVKKFGIRRMALFTVSAYKKIEFLEIQDGDGRRLGVSGTTNKQVSHKPIFTF